MSWKHVSATNEPFGVYIYTGEQVHITAMVQPDETTAKVLIQSEQIGALEKDFQDVTKFGLATQLKKLARKLDQEKHLDTMLLLLNGFSYVRPDHIHRSA